MKCLRCGIELKDTIVFCPECSKITSVPLQPSPYLSKKIHLPKRKPPQPPKKPEVKKPAKKEGHPLRRILCTGALTLLCVALLLQSGYTYREKDKLATELERLQSVEDECVRLTDKLRQAEQTAYDLEEELANLGSSTYLTVRENLKAAEEENARLQRELTRTQETIRGMERQLDSLREKTEFFDTHIVFIQEDNTGLFHSYDCEKFTRHGYRAYNKQQAVSLGYTPCPHCQ